MGFIKGFKTKYISNSIILDFESSKIWKEITDVMVSKMKYPFLFKLLGVPKPISAEVKKEGVGGYRVAHFSNDAQFHQEILEWKPLEKYRFDFNASKNFKVGHFMNLSNGPFKIKTGGYHLEKTPNGISLTLSSNYQVKGLFGALMHVPIRIVVYAFQKHLLKGILNNLKN